MIGMTERTINLFAGERVRRTGMDLARGTTSVLSPPIRTGTARPQLRE